MRYIAFIILALLTVMVAGCAPTDGDVATVNDASTVQAEDSMTSGEYVPITQQSFEFEGYAPGKSHVGTFTEMSGELLLDNGQIVGIRGTINPATVKSDSSGLDSHLKNEDFFFVEQFPDITFDSKTIVDGQMTGVLTFLGVSKEITFPVTIEGNTLSTEFMLDMKPFGMKYVAVDENVRIAFSATY